jgi:hypothetical protein
VIAKHDDVAGNAPSGVDRHGERQPSRLSQPTRKRTHSKPAGATSLNRESVDSCRSAFAIDR